MIKRFKPSQPDGQTLRFALPEEYILGTEITLFVNGQLLAVQDDEEHPYGYYLDDSRRIFTFYIPPYSTDFLYIMYEIADPFDIYFDNIDWSKSIKRIDFTPKVNKQEWKIDTERLEWKQNTTEIDWKVDTYKAKWKVDTKTILFSYSCSK